jgi:hypothetical protein
MSPNTMANVRRIFRMAVLSTLAVEATPASDADAAILL